MGADSSPRKSSYRPEIDGLRALAVLAVLANHLNPSLLPGGYLGVDLFFVISGHVVTSSLANRTWLGKRDFLLGFYQRRFRRLLPALILNVLVVALLFSALAHPGDNTVTEPILRSGIASLLGISNLYFIRQGTNYFGSDTGYNPFSHTWSLGVEEQFYLVWPLLLIACGMGMSSPQRWRPRLKWLTGGLITASMLLFLHLWLGGRNTANFYLMPTRFWELAAGALAWLQMSGRQRSAASADSQGWLHRALPWGLLGGFLLLLLPSEQWRIPATLAGVAVSYGMLLALQPDAGPGRLLSQPTLLAIGLRSYSLYLWHWPVIVLAKWSVGLSRLTIIPVMIVITVLTLISYRLESYFRSAGHGSIDRRHDLILYPILSLGGAGVIALLLGPAQGLLFVGDRSRRNLDLGYNQRIPGTTIDTIHCFREPEAALQGPEVDAACRVIRHPQQPTLFFEGDSHTQMLIPLGEDLLEAGSFNVAYFARGGCPTPWFTPWANNTDRQQTYRLCRAHSLQRLARLPKVIKPGDQLLLVSNLPGYLLGGKPEQQSRAMAAYSHEIDSIAVSLRQIGASLVVFAPLPSFPRRPHITVPASLCLPEWFRGTTNRHPGCSVEKRSRSEIVRSLQPVRRLLDRLAHDHPNLTIFDPFATICPPGPTCDTHRGETMLFTDNIHLSRAGAKMLANPLLQTLQRSSKQARGNSSPSKATPAAPQQ